MSRVERVLIVIWEERPISIGFARAFARAGVQAQVFELAKANTWQDRLLFHTINHWAHNLRLVPKSKDLFAAHPLNHRNWRSSQLVEKVRQWRPQLVFVVRTKPVTPEALAQVRELSALFGWWIHGENRFEETYPEVGLYDMFYFFSSECLNWSRQRGHQAVDLLIHAIDTQLYYPLENQSQRHDWVFVGAWDRVRQEIMESLAGRSANFAIYGPNWRKRNRGNRLLGPGIKGQEIWGQDLVRLYNQARVALNVSQWGGPGRRRVGMNLRVLEALACRACLLTDYAEDAGDFLRPEEHFAVYEGPAQAAQALGRLLEEPERRERLAAAGYARVVPQFSYDARVEQLLADYQRLRP